MKFGLKKYWFNGFVYISIIFLFIILLNSDYLIIPEIYSVKYLLFSFLSLFLGFLLNAAAWGQILNSSGFPVSYKHSMSSTGLAVFGKYIPGKVWALVGQAGYIINKTKYSKSKVAALVLNALLILIWLGLILSVIGIFFLGEYWFVGIVFSVICIVLTITIFTSILHKVIEGLVRKVLKRNINILRLSNKALLKTSLWYLLNWMFWCIGFYFLTKSLGGSDIHISAGLSFPLAVCVGIFALIFPGGIGVREGVLIAYLTASGLDVQLATTISIASRLWFLIGECFIFSLGFIMDKFK